MCYVNIFGVGAGAPHAREADPQPCPSPAPGIACGENDSNGNPRVSAGGRSAGFGKFNAVGKGASLGFLNHEMGHALNLPHWSNSQQRNKYPYRGDMCAVDRLTLTLTVSFNLKP